MEVEEVDVSISAEENAVGAINCILVQIKMCVLRLIFLSHLVSYVACKLTYKSASYVCLYGSC